MKTLFGMAAAVLLTVIMLVVSLPENAAAAEKVTLTEMVKIKKAADEAVQAAKAQKEKAKTVAERRIAKELLKQAEINAEVAGELLEAVKAGEEVSREEADACAAIAEAVHEAAAALAAGDTGKAEAALYSIAELGDRLPTAANARAEMQRADGAWKNQIVKKPCFWGECDGEFKKERVWSPKVGVECSEKTGGITMHIMPCWTEIMCIEGCIDYSHPCEQDNVSSYELQCEPDEICQNGECMRKNEIACTCTGGGGLAVGAVKNSAARSVFDRNCVNGRVVEDSCYSPSPSVPHNCPCPAPAK